MKYVFLFLAGCCISVLTHAQDIKYNNGQSQIRAQIKLKVMLSKDSMSVNYKNQPVAITSIQALDSLIKTIADPKSLDVEFESLNAEAEKIKSVNTVLNQCHCPIVRKSIRFNKY